MLGALAEDGDLRAWFTRLGALPEGMRAKELLEIAGRMRAAGEDAELVQTAAMLANAELFSAAQAALADFLACRKASPRLPSTAP